MARASLSEISPWQFPQNPSPRSGKSQPGWTPHIYAEGILGMNEITIKDPYTKRCMMPYTNHLTIGFTFALRCQLAPPKKKGPAQTAVGKGCENKLYISYSCVKRHYLICVKKTISFTVSFVLKLFGSVWCTVKVFWCQRRIGVTFIWSNDVERFLAQMDVWRNRFFWLKSWSVLKASGVKGVWRPSYLSLFGVKGIWC